MPQHLTDRRQTSATAEQLRGQSVPEPVRSDSAQPGSLTGLLGDVVDEFGPDRAVGRLEEDEHLPAPRSGATATQVLDDGFADVGWQR
jgi:hypothetical protein